MIALFLGCPENVAFLLITALRTDFNAKDVWLFKKLINVSASVITSVQ